MTKYFAIALVASLVVASPAIASSPEVQTRRVQVADLDLGNAKGRATLDRRIKAAAKNICSDGGGYGRLIKNSEAQCMQEAIDSTRPQVARLMEASGRQIAMSDLTIGQ